MSSLRIALRTSSGFLCAENGGDDQGIVHSNRPAAGAWETLTVEPQGDGQVAFRTSGGRYLCAEGGGGGDLHANRTAAGAWEKWTPSGPIVDQAGLTFTAVDGGHYMGVGADPAHTVHAKASLPVVWTVTVLEGGEAPTPPVSGGEHESGVITTYSHPENLAYGFQDDHGKPWQMVAYSAYLLVSCVKKGQDIVPFLRNLKSYGGINTIVTLGAALSPWCVDNGFGFDPREQATKDAITSMFETCAAEGLRVCHMVASDFQYGGLSDADKSRIWNEQCDLMWGRWNLFAACGKEQNVNGWDPSLFPRNDLGGVLQSAGSAGEGVAPLQPPRDFSMWETRNHLEGAGWHKVLDDAGAGMFEQNAGYAGFPATRCPIVMIEGLHLADTNPDHVGDKRETNSAKALQFGLQVGASCAGGAVLTSLGQEGKIDGDVAQHCAMEQIRGMRTAFLR